MKKNYLLILVLSVIFAACSKTEAPLTQDQQNQESDLLYKKGSSSSKEIKGTLTYSYTEAFDLSCYTCGEGTFSGGNYLGTGDLSHLGDVSSPTKACIGFIMSGQNVIGVHITGQCTSFKAPNGDEIYLTNDDYDLYLNSQGVAVGNCKFYFSGGTGKYKNASGSFVGSVKNPLQGTFTVDVCGNLKY